MNIYHYNGTADFTDIEVTDFDWSLAQYNIDPITDIVVMSIALPGNMQREITATIENAGQCTCDDLETWLCNDNNSILQGSTLNT